MSENDSFKAWKKRASMAKTRGFKLLYAAMKCFELAESAEAQAKLRKEEARP